MNLFAHGISQSAEFLYSRRLSFPAHWSSLGNISRDLGDLWRLQCRGYKKHYVNRPNLAQRQDVNTIDLHLARATTPTAAALPILQCISILNPRQTSSMLQKLQHMEVLHVHRLGMLQPASKPWSAEQGQASHALMKVLQARLINVMPDCSPEQLQRGLWGLSVASRRHTSSPQDGLPAGAPPVADGLGAWLRDRSGHSYKTLSHAAWWLAASGLGRHAAMDDIAAHMNLAVASTSEASSPEAGPDVIVSPPVAGRAALSAQKKSALAVQEAESKQHDTLDHRSICRFAWAFSTSAVAQEDAWDSLCSSAAVSLEAMTKGHNPANGPLQPRMLYMYRTIQGWTTLPEPRPYQPSKYLFHNGPRLIVDSFDLQSATSLLASLGRAGRRDERLLSALERLIVAMLPLPAEGADGGESGDVRARATLPGAPGGLMPGVGRKLLPIDASHSEGWRSGEGVLKMPSLAAGTARAKVGASGKSVLSKRMAGQILRGFYDLKRRSPEVAAAVLYHAGLIEFSAQELAAAAYLSVKLGMRDDAGAGQGLMSRLVAAALPLMAGAPMHVLALLDASAQKAGCVDRLQLAGIAP